MRPLLSTPLVLSAQEKQDLEQIVRRHTAPRCLVQRARIILLAAQNGTVPAIAAKLQVCANTVRKWIKRYTPMPQPTSSSESSAPKPPAPEPADSKLALLA